MRLIIVPGLGDNAFRYRAVLPLWRACGFSAATVYPFGWNGSGIEFAVRFRNFMSFVRPLAGENIMLLGASAGGTVVANALLERPEWVTRAVAVASPLWGSATTHNDLLAESIARLRPALISADEGMRQNLASYFGEGDEKVATTRSYVRGAANRIVATGSHNRIIARSITLHAWEICRWLRTGDRSIWMF